LKFWVSSAISRNVRELELKIYNDCRPKLDNLNFGGIELPESIYTSKTLENLKLDLRFFIKAPPPGICFPSVKILDVLIYPTNKNLSERLFCNCPMLSSTAVEVAKSGWQFRHFNLTTMPKLEAFVLRMVKFFNFKWIEPHCAPQCLLIRVKKIEILSFGGQKDEMELVKYLLKNGEGLNRMMIVFTNSAPKKKLRQELLRLERGSTNCEGSS
ncbi:hypothetical protein CISIN_1g039476mg, partial [Citrus sinensis]